MPPPAERPRLVARCAWILIVVAVVVAAIRSAPALLHRYGYRSVRSESVGHLYGLTLEFERRRADWLPIPAERLRVSNERREEVARLHRDGPALLGAGSLRVHCKIESVESGIALEFGDARLELVPDADGVLVPAGSLPTPPTRPEDAYRGFEGLRLHSPG